MNKASYGETSGFTPVSFDESQTVNGGIPVPALVVYMIAAGLFLGFTALAVTSSKSK
jgi:hypothetical protein